MHYALRRLLITLICLLPSFASAAVNYPIHAEWASYTPPSGFTVAGFKLYQAGSPACQIQGSTATSMDCTVSLTADTSSFTLAATFSDGTESAQSSPMAFTAAAVNAVITANTVSGPAPLSVNFDGSGSTGAIASYLWNFGDGTTATGSTATHAYTTAGTYTAKLTVTDASGVTSTASLTVTVTASTTTSTSPTAVITSSTAAGQAPLAVTFSGSGSKSASGTTIASYAWNFGDGSTATGVSVSHSFTTAGTYNTTLTVTDSKGLTNSTSTPIVVTATTTTTNKAPTAVASVTPTSGTAPLAVTFDGSASTDTDGSIASYIWNFGDGSTASGKTAAHTYTTAGNYTATLTVTDNLGATGSTTKTITVQTLSTISTIWPATAVPQKVDAGADSSLELGVKFRADANGYINGIRFYKASTNTGTHVANLWSSTGKLLATATFTNETGSGWQQVQFSAPVAITANTVYVASYHCTTGHYSADQNYFKSAGMDSPPLHALANGVSGVNGVYSYGTSSIFPTNGWNASNYWVDVMFQQATQTTSTTSTIWPSATVPNLVDAGADSSVELGAKFRSDVNGYITGIRFYKASTNTGTHVANLWSSAGQLLATATFSNETASGWQQVNFSTPVAVTANTVYVASYHCTGGHYSADQNYFASVGMDSPPLHALANGTSGVNGVYAYGSSSIFPTNGWNASNYWVDVMFRQ